MSDEIASTALQRLLGINKSVLSELTSRGIVVRAERRGRYKLESVTRYCQHLREISAGRGNEAGAEARARLGAAQADLAEAKAAQIRGETVPLAEVETFWRSKFKAFAIGCSPSRAGCETHRRSNRLCSPKSFATRSPSWPMGSGGRYQMKPVLVGLTSLVFATSAEAADAWTCTYAMSFNSGGVSEPVLVRFEISTPDLIETKTQQHYRILQNNDYGLVATSSISGIEEGQKNPTVGAVSVVIDKGTGTFWWATTITTGETTLANQFHGKCLKD